MQVKSIDLADTLYQDFSWVRPGFVACCALMVEFYGAPALLREYRCNEPPQSGSMRAYLDESVPGRGLGHRPRLPCLRSASA